MYTGITETEVETAALRAERQCLQGRFLMGPISMDPIIAASNLPGKALAVYLTIRHQVDVTRRSEISVPAGLLGAMHVSRDAKARALRDLEQAGLISVRREVGRAARVRLLR